MMYDPRWGARGPKSLSWSEAVIFWSAVSNQPSEIALGGSESVRCQGRESWVGASNQGTR